MSFKEKVSTFFVCLGQGWPTCGSWTTCGSLHSFMRLLRNYQRSH